MSAEPGHQTKKSIPRHWLMWALYWLLVICTVGIYLTMVTWTLPEIAASAGGLAPFDMRPTGYTYQEAITFLKALNRDGRDLYLGMQHFLDQLFPAMLAMVLVIALLKLAPSFWCVLFGLFAVAGSIFDYLENIAVAVMLGPNMISVEAVTQDLVESASTWTVLKSACTTVAYSALLVLLFLSAYRRFSRSKKAES